MKKLFFLTLILIISRYAEAQFTTPILDNTPPSVKWMQVNSPNFRVLFLKGSDSLALRTINTMETLYQPSLATLQTQPEKITIILQQKNAISNGFVTVGPRRSEFYGMPPQDYNFSGTNNWIDMLAVHEYRHVVQFSKSKRGFNSVIYYLFGEDAYGALAQLAMPSWFWEGDAVGVETALTNSGRGRIPHFSMPFRTNLLVRGPYSYDKQMLRSFKDFVPNHYVSGYYMTTHMRRKYDKEIWDRVTDRSFFAPFLPWRLPIALNRETGKGLKSHYGEMIDEVTAIWEAQHESLEETEAIKINKRRGRTFTNYDYPQLDGDGNIIALKYGLGDVQQFVSIDAEGNEKVVFVPGILNDAGMLSVAGDKLVYVEHEFNPRWRADAYSVIKCVDLNKKTVRRITDKSRYSAASLSPDQRLIATAITTVSQQTSLAVIDSENGVEVKIFPNPENDYYQMPRWSDDGSSIVALKIRDQQKSITLIDYKSGQEQIVAPFRFENYGHPVKHGDYVFYNSSYDGIDNIYAIDLTDGVHYRVTSRKYGAFNPVISADGTMIFYNDYTIDGMDIVAMPFDPEFWIPKEIVEDRNDYYYKPLVEQEAGENLLINIEEKDYEITGYSRFRGLINPYAWGIYSSTTADEFLLGVVSQDVLSTATISGGYQFDRYGERSRWYGKVSYQALFPIIDVGFESINRNELGLRGEEEFTYRFNEIIATAGLRLPLLLTRSRFHEHLTLSTNVSYGRFGNFNETPFGDRTDYRMLTHNIDYYRLMKQSKRDIRSKWGLFVFTQYSHFPIGGDFQGEQFAAQGALYFPGLVKHHSLKLTGNYQYQPRGTFPFSRFVMRPRGDNRSFRNEQFMMGSVDYALPLAYPDVNIGSVVNFQRIKSNLFYDFGVGDDYEGDRNFYNSVGVELSADINILRLLPLFEIGIRYAYVPELGVHMVSPMVGMFSF